MKRKRIWSLGLITGFCGLIYLPAQFAMPHFGGKNAAAHLSGNLPAMPAGIEVTLFNNDSVAHLFTTLGAECVDFSDTLDPDFVFEVNPRFLECITTVMDTQLYRERWDTLAQPTFWRIVMNMGMDSCVVNIGNSRKIIEIRPTWWWETKSDSLQESYRDSIRQELGLEAGTPVLVTAGKRHYYKFDKVLPSIGKGIRKFESLNVDPWYAQAILLIESPGQLQYSPVGAYGSFQLMKQVALEHGLVVNDSVDEREDFEKSAGAAADLIASRCIPQTRYMLRKRNITFTETDLWFRLLVLHSYHAGAGNVEAVLQKINPTEGGQQLLLQMWKTESGGFKNASQNYSQVALASLLELNHRIEVLPDSVCRDTAWGISSNLPRL
ncbi:MAG: transglycosylase SLT domain-containing protein [Bacteroidia bacterium]|nr:transglycosylase SLT domain-containing protein [Bacteroidia bacterium]